MSHSRILHSYGDVTINGEGPKILTYIRHSWSLSSEFSLACQKRQNHQKCSNLRTTFSMATQFTHLYWLYLSDENRIDFKRYEISLEQIVQSD